jgi:DNA-binding NarL/FixJ family response regulator
MIKVLLVDDHKMIRDGVRSMLSQMKNIKVVGECSNGNEAIAYLKENNDDVDIIIMDINMPILNGIEATQQLVANDVKAKIIAMTMRGEDKYISKMLAAGAVGYILKDSGKDELFKAIIDVHGGEKYFSNEVRISLVSSYLNKKSTNGLYPDEFSAREIEVLICISEGLTNKLTGEKLFISSRTVETHRRNMLQKAGVNNTIELIKYGIKNGLIEYDIS